MRYRLLLVLLCGACATPAPASPQAAAKPPAFSTQRALVPMRDGVRLETLVFSPNDAGKPLPILLTRTPYGLPADARVLDDEWFKTLRKDGYIFVMQSLRGRFGSEGSFVADRPARDRSVPGSIDETTDAYDTIAWLLQNVPENNGRVGMVGGSYAAWAATLALIEPHPALKVVAEAASPADQFIGDDLHHLGALRLSYAFEFSVLLDSSRERNTVFAFDQQDSYDWYLTLGPLSNVNARHLHGQVASWNNLVAHPNRDDFWAQASMESRLERTHVPVLNVVGSWDQEDFYGPQKIYELLERNDDANINHIVIGPWNHGGWSGVGRSLAGIDFGSDTGTYYRERIQAPWLACWLHDRPGTTPEAHVFVTGRNEWRELAHWPPRDQAVPTRIYLQANQGLTFEPPREQRAWDEYISDPADPVPYVRRPIRPMAQNDSDWPIWQALDQRFLGERPDVRSWQSEPLEHDVEIAGELSAELFASTTGTDSDWVIKLIDVQPDGYQLMIAAEVLRARFRDSFVDPQPVEAEKVVRYEVPLRAHAHAFLRGHRIMVQVQSSWFPLIDRNPQHFVPNIFEAKPSDFIRTTQRIFRSTGAPTAIVLPIVR